MAIKIENKNGKLVGIDENGNEVPIDFGSVALESLDSAVNFASQYAGANMAEQIEAAITDLPAGGGVVIVPEGSHTIPRAVTDQGRDNVWLRGYGSASELVLEAGVNDNIIEIDGQSDWRVSHLAWDGQEPNQSDGGDRFDQCGVWVRNSSNIEIDHCHGRDVVYTHVRLWADGSGNELTNVTVHHNDVRGTRSHFDVADNVSDGYSVTNRNSGKHRNIKFLYNYAQDIGAAGIESTRDFEDIRIIGNKVINPTRFGVMAHNSDAGPPRQLVVAHNFVEGGSAQGGDEAHFVLAANFIRSFGNVSDTAPNVAYQIGRETSSDLSRFGSHVGNVAVTPTSHGALLWAAEQSLFSNWSVAGAGGDSFNVPHSGTTNVKNDNCTFAVSLSRNPTGVHFNIGTNVSGTIENLNQTV